MAFRTVLLIFATAVAGMSLAAQTPTTDQKSGPVHQLRIYEIFERNKAAFHDRFRDHAARIMKRYDFHIVALWESRKDDRTEFVYLIEWPDEATMKDGWAKWPIRNGLTSRKRPLQRKARSSAILGPRVALAGLFAATDFAE